MNNIIWYLKEKWYATIAAIAGVIILISLMLFLSGFSNGVRYGNLIKLSEKGFIFKTYEGTLKIGDEATVNAWVFNFSIEDTDLAEELLKNVGRDVIITYEQRYFTWFYDTDYFVVDFKIKGEE